MGLKKKIIMGTIVGTLALAGILSMPFVFRKTKTYSTGCETYQGYRRGLDGEAFFYFDEKTMKERGDEVPNYLLLGNPEWIEENKLEIGKSYRLEIDGIMTLGSFQQCTDSEPEQRAQTQKR